MGVPFLCALTVSMLQRKAGIRHTGRGVHRILDSHELACELKQKRPEVQILIVSADHEDGFPPEAVHQSDALLKPVDTPTLLRKADEFLLWHRALQITTVEALVVNGSRSS